VVQLPFGLNVCSFKRARTSSNELPKWWFGASFLHSSLSTTIKNVVRKMISRRCGLRSTPGYISNTGDLAKGPCGGYVCCCVSKDRIDALDELGELEDEENDDLGSDTGALYDGAGVGR